MKVPLLEYLDKLEAKAKADLTHCSTPMECYNHRPTAIQIALIAKLREMASALRDYAGHLGAGFAPPCDFESIEVPE